MFSSKLFVSAIFVSLSISRVAWQGENFLRVKETPPRMMVVRAGSRLSLRCSVLGSPAPQVFWIKDGGDEDRKHVKMRTTDQGLAEVFSAVSVSCVHPSHSGVYTCVGQAPGGDMVKISTKVFVVGGGHHDDRSQEHPGDCLHDGEAPTVIGWFNTLMVPIGHTARLDCNIKVSQDGNYF